MTLSEALAAFCEREWRKASRAVAKGAAPNTTSPWVYIGKTDAALMRAAILEHVWQEPAR